MLINNLQDLFNDNNPNIITNYLELQNIIKANESIIFKDLFEQIKDHRLKSSNILDNDIIRDGISLDPEEKKKTNRIKFDSNKLIETVSQNFSSDVNDLDKAYYLKSLVSLINNIDYIDEEEEFLFDCLFDDISLDNKHLEKTLYEDKQYMMK